MDQDDRLAFAAALVVDAALGGGEDRHRGTVKFVEEMLPVWCELVREITEFACVDT
jgi:hypothetical protein